MSSLLDVIGSVLIFGIVMLMALQLNVFTLEKNTQAAFRSMNQETITGSESFVGLGGTLESDLVKIGGGDIISPSIMIADSTQLNFRADIDGNGTVDSVRYYITTPGSIPPGGNPNLKYFYRRQNTESGNAGWVGVSSLNFAYLDGMGRTISTPVLAGALSSIRSVRVKLMVEGKTRLKTDTDTSFAASYWETLISPVNIK